MKYLLLGKDGQVGWELQRALAPLGTLIALGRRDMDLLKPQAMASILNAYKPRVIVNAAAYTAVDKAESEPHLARAINTDSVAALARYAADNRAWLVHYSTDYVFDGTGVATHHETEETAPLNIYGTTKRDGERAIEESGARHLTFRTSWVHGSHGANFIRTMLRLGQSREVLNVVADQIGAPTGAELIADVTAHALRQVTEGDDAASGIYHIAAAGETSWHAYAQLVIKEAWSAGVPMLATPERVLPISTADYPTPAIRPLNSRLNIDKLQNKFATTLPRWEHGVQRTVREISRQVS